MKTNNTKKIVLSAFICSSRCSDGAACWPKCNMTPASAFRGLFSLRKGNEGSTNLLK